MTHQQCIPIHLITSTGFNGPTAASFSYDSSDPYVVRLNEADNSSARGWVLPRDLLWYSLQVPGKLRGMGDIKVQVDGDYFRIFLDVPTGTASLRMTKYDLIEFMEKTIKIVPLGDESKIVQDELDDVLPMILSEGV